MIRTRIPILRRDGIIQRYHTTKKRLSDRGYEYDDEIEAWIDFSKFALEPYVPPEEIEAPPLPIPPREEPPFWTVMFYTDYKADKERFEVRVSIQAKDESDAIERGMSRALTTLPDDYLAFMDALGVFENQAVERIEARDTFDGAQYFRYPMGGRRGEARKFT